MKVCPWHTKVQAHVTSLAGAKFIRKQCVWINNWEHISDETNTKWFQDWNKQKNGRICDRVVFYDGERVFTPCAWNDEGYTFMEVVNNNLLAIDDDIWDDTTVRVMKAYQGQQS